MEVEISDCNGSGDWLKTAPTKVAEGDGSSMCETDRALLEFNLIFILGYILKGGETQLSKLHILTKFDKILFSLLNIFRVFLIFLHSKFGFL